MTQSQSYHCLVVMNEGYENMLDETELFLLKYWYWLWWNNSNKSNVLSMEILRVGTR